jgi:hypothetical protein
MKDERRRNGEDDEGHRYCQFVENCLQQVVHVWTLFVASQERSLVDGPSLLRSKNFRSASRRESRMGSVGNMSTLRRRSPSRVAAGPLT